MSACVSTPVAHNARFTEIGPRPPKYPTFYGERPMMERKRSRVAIGLLLAVLTAGCGDGAQPLGPDVEARLNTGDSADERGPGAVIGSGREGTTTTSDSTGRGPGAVIGSG